MYEEIDNPQEHIKQPSKQTLWSYLILSVNISVTLINVLSVCLVVFVMFFMPLKEITLKVNELENRIDSDEVAKKLAEFENRTARDVIPKKLAELENRFDSGAILKKLAELENRFDSDEIAKKLAELENRFDSGDEIAKKLAELETRIDSEEVPRTLAELETHFDSDAILKKLAEFENRINSDEVPKKLAELEKRIDSGAVMKKLCEGENCFDNDEIAKQIAELENRIVQKLLEDFKQRHKLNMEDIQKLVDTYKQEVDIKLVSQSQCTTPDALPSASPLPYTPTSDSKQSHRHNGKRNVESSSADDSDRPDDQSAQKGDYVRLALRITLWILASCAFLFSLFIVVLFVKEANQRQLNLAASLALLVCYTVVIGSIYYIIVYVIL